MMVLMNSLEILTIILTLNAVSTTDSDHVLDKSASYTESQSNDLISEEIVTQNVRHQKEPQRNERPQINGHESNFINSSLVDQRNDALIYRNPKDDIASLGLAVLGGVALVAPMIFPEFKKTMERSMSIEDRQGLSNFITSRLVGVSESIMGWVERSVDDLPSLPRLDAQECMKRCICEAHNQPKKYGIIGLMLQLFFPPYTEAEEPLKVVSKYQLAARYGRQDNANCATQYDGCMVNFLDMVQGVINLVF